MTFLHRRTRIAAPLFTSAIFFGAALFLAACGADSGQPAAGEDRAQEALHAPDHAQPGETHLRNVRQLTPGGENAEAYWAFDGSALIYQARKPGAGCDRIYVMDDLETGESRMVSTGDGRTTCSYFYPSGDRILYSSTHLAGPACPPEPDFSQGYVWPIYKSYDIFAADADGGNLRQLTEADGYDAEATFSPVGDRIVFTSARDGDLELYSMAPDGSDVQRLTNRIGYDGGAFYSPDGSQNHLAGALPRTGTGTGRLSPPARTGPPAARRAGDLCHGCGRLEHAPGDAPRRG